MQKRQNVDYTTRDYEGFRNDMITLLKQKLPQYSDFSSSDAGIVLIELLAHGLDILSYYNDKVANELFAETAVERESIVKHCRRLGYELQNSTPSRFRQVFKIIPQEYNYVIPKGFKIESKGDDTVVFELIEDLVIPKGCTGLEQDEEGNYLYSTIVEEGETINNDIIGTSNGQPNQEFYLSYKPIIVDSLRVFVSDMNGTEEYERVTNFIDSDLSSTVFSVEVSDNGDTKIQFGSGTSGTIPPIFDNGISASYRIGGGEIGNIAIDNLTEIPEKPAIIVETFCIEQIQYGREREDMEEARVKAPASIKTIWRAVCPEDYNNLLMQEFKGEVARVKTIPQDDRFTINVYVFLEGDKELTSGLAKKYLDFLDERKEIGYELNILPVTFEDITINVQAKTNKSYMNEDIKGMIEACILNDYEKGVLGFGEEFVSSQLIGNLMSLRGIYDVNVEVEGNTTPQEHKMINVANINIEVIGGI